MNFIIDYWYIILAAIAVVVVLISAIVAYFRMPTDEQIKALKEWLLYAVTLCEKELGEKTGKLKLRMCYDMAVTKFPWIMKVITFEEFSVFVDEALVKMREMLDNNSHAQVFVEGD